MFEQMPPSDNQQSISKEKIKAKESQREARITEKRVGRFMFQLIQDMRMKLRTRRERKVLSQEEHKLKLRNKWARLVWRDPNW